MRQETFPRCRPLLPRILLLLSILLGTRPILAAAGPDTALYNRDRPVDFVHMRLEMTFTPEDIRNRSASGRVEYELRARGEEVKSIELDAIRMQILGVELPGEDAEPVISYDDQRLTIELPRPIGTDESLRLAVRYRLEDPAMGLHFVLPNPSMPSRRLAVYTHSETMRARHWLPSHDWPNERWTSEIAVTVPALYTVVANGILQTQTPWADDRMITYSWKNDVPIDPHLMGFVFGEFGQVQQGDWRGHPVWLYAHPDDIDSARYTLRHVPKMIAWMSKLTGVGYPFPAYTHVVLPDHFHGGMEHGGYSLLSRQLLTSGPAGKVPYDFVEMNFVSHMLGHNWFAGIVNYRTAAEAWLNEGFATYLHFLWQGHNDSPEVFEAWMWERARAIAKAETGAVPLVHGKFKDPEDIYRFDGGKVYWKGAWVLHMLRRELGDELFWRGVKTYLNSHRFAAVESSDLRRVLEDVSGRDLEQFFTQWIHGSGFPRLKVSYAWEAAKAATPRGLAAGTATVHLEQTRAVDAKAPLFSFPLELYFRVGDRDEIRTVRVSGAVHDYAFEFETEPTQFAIDPQNRLLADSGVTKPHALTIAQARSGPTVTARMAAVRKLAGEPHPEAVAVLGKLLADGDAPWLVRAEAADALGRAQRADSLQVLLAAHQRGVERRSAGGQMDHRRVRAAVLSALAKYSYSREAHEILVQIHPARGPVEVEAAAVRGLGNMRSTPELVTRSVERLRQAASQTSRRWVRQAAVNAMRKLDDVRLFDIVLALIQPDDDFRRFLIPAVGSLGHHEEHHQRAREILARWLDDPDRDTQDAAILGLQALGDPKTIPELHRLAESGRRSSLRVAAEKAIMAIQVAPKTSPHPLSKQVHALEAQNQKLEKSIRELRERLEKVE